MRPISLFLRDATVLAALAVLCGCGAVSGDPYETQPVPASKAMIYIYRPFRVTGSVSTPMITCGPDSIELLPGGYHSFLADPGPIACASSGNMTAPLKFDIHAGGEYYVKEEVSGALTTTTALTLVSSSGAKGEIAETRRQSVATKLPEEK
jgi:hypothetical protein